jgi:hypothetical protein
MVRFGWGFEHEKHPDQCRDNPQECRLMAANNAAMRPAPLSTRHVIKLSLRALTRDRSFFLARRLVRFHRTI